MKKFTMFSNYLLLLAVAAIFGLTACGDDPILNTEIPPSATITADAEAAPGGIITLNISGSRGDADMDLLTITENGANISLDRINSTDIGANPALLAGDNASAFGFTVEIDAPTAPAAYTYAAIVRDLNGRTDEASVEVTILSAPPTITYMGTNPREVSLGGNIFNVTATPGGANLSTIAVFEDGELVDPTRLELDGVDFDVNPYSLVGDDQAGFDMASVLIRFLDAGTTNITFEVEDVNGETASTEVSVEVEAPGTPVTNTYTASLLSNADGPANVLGGLNLYTGENVSVNSDFAYIIDLGLDLTTGEWRQQIQGNNGTELRSANPNSPELFNFENINSREAIIGAYDSAIIGNTSGVVSEGDVFLANRGGDYFIMTVTDITVTPNNNEDRYLFNIKTSEL